MQGCVRRRWSAVGGFLLVACLFVCLPRPAAAQPQESRVFGLGIIIGDPTGVSGKYLVSPEFAVDGAIGFGLIGEGHLHMHVDFLWQFEIKRWSTAQLDL